MTHEELRYEITKQLNLTDHDEQNAVWNFLVESRYITDYNPRPDEDELEDMLSVSKRFIKHARRMPNPRIRPKLATGQNETGTKCSSSDYEVLCEDALADYVAGKASNDPLVIAFRDQILGGRLMGFNHARRLLSSPAIHFLSLKQFENLGVCLIQSHESVIIDSWLSGDRDHLVHNVEIEFNEDTEPQTFSNDSFLCIGNLTLSPREETLVGEPKYDDRMVRNLGWEGSFYLQILDLASTIAERYNWTNEDTMMFLLSGQLPGIAPAVGWVRTRESPVLSRSYITLEIEPWCSTETVCKTYRELKKQIGVTERTSYSRNLELVKFVNKNALKCKNKIDWTNTIQHWNKVYKESASFKSDKTKKEEKNKEELKCGKRFRNWSYENTPSGSKRMARDYWCTLNRLLCKITMEHDED